MYDRKILENLKKWKESKHRKPLILRGARQVGKTTVVELFKESFSNYIYLNLEIFRDREIFKETLNIQQIYQAILLSKNIRLLEGPTLLFIDEIQNSPIAIKNLRYFYEELPEIHVVAAGSLLEVVLNKENIIFPVGRVEYLFMYPLNFEEYLTALKEDNLLEIYYSEEIPEFAYDKISETFHQYILYGGMPEIIERLIEGYQLVDLSRIYQSLLQSYLDDAIKYADGRIYKNVLRHCLETAPFEAGKRIKYQGFGNSNYQTREVKQALQQLERAMLIRIIYPTTVVKLPLTLNIRKSPKLQFLDTGLLNYILGIQSKLIIHSDLQQLYQGLLIEHIVRQELQSLQTNTDFAIPFWVREKRQSTAEVDFILQIENRIIPVEVKAGKSGTLRSLHQFINNSNVDFAIRFWNSKVQLDDLITPSGKKFKLLNLPYAIAGRVHHYMEKYI